jgi:alanyl-tRNA synthetase
LRFDFSHPKPMSAEEIERVEDIANEFVLQNAPVVTRVMALDDARASGARALFGEKYGDEVRVVAMGEGGGNTMGWSVELCGGTHVRRTGDIGLISVVGESGVAGGVRRIEALTGAIARKELNKNRSDIRTISAEMNAPLGEVTLRATAVVADRKRLERELSDAKKKLAMGGDGGAAAGGGDGTYARSSGFIEGTAVMGVRQVSGTSLFALTVKDFDLKDLRSLADEGKKKVGSGVVAIVGISPDGKAGIVVGVTDDLVKRFNAVDLVRKGAEVLGGKGGGGRPDMAQAGGPDASKADAALAAIEAALGG